MGRRGEEESLRPSQPYQARRGCVEGAALLRRQELPEFSHLARVPLPAQQHRRH